jgi:hypothetical protein
VANRKVPRYYVVSFFMGLSFSVREKICIYRTRDVDPDWFNPDPNTAFLLNPDPETDPDPTLNLLRFARLQLYLLQKLFQQNFALLMLFLSETVATLGGNFPLNWSEISLYAATYIFVSCHWIRIRILNPDPNIYWIRIHNPVVQRNRNGTC